MPGIKNIRTKTIVVQMKNGIIDIALKCEKGVRSRNLPFPALLQGLTSAYCALQRRLAVGAHRSAPVEGGGGVGEPRQRVRRKG